MGTRTCQWAQGRVSGHKGVSVGTRTCQWAQGPVSGHTGLSVDKRALQWAQSLSVDTTSPIVNCITTSFSNTSHNKSKEVRQLRLQPAAGGKNFHFFQSRGGGFYYIEGGGFFAKPPPLRGGKLLKPGVLGGGVFIINFLVGVTC